MRSSLRKLSIALLPAILLGCHSAAAQDRAQQDDDEPGVASRTLGGMQFWTDQVIHGSWRIQRNVVTGHYRLLGDEDERHAWGTYDTCRAELDQLHEGGKLPQLQPKAVIVLHGLMRTRDSMSSLADFLATEGDYSVMNMSYASTRDTIGQHARALARVVKHLGPEVTEINFVAHSMGNLVIRHYLSDREGGDPRIRRIVMLGPPNHGAAMARAAKDLKPVRWVLGDSGSQLWEDWEQLEPHLALPQCDFGIIAGGKNNESGYAFWLPGDDDGVVRVEETRLEGARDFKLVECFHTFLMDQPVVMESTLRFLEHGRFEDAGGGDGAGCEPDRRCSGRPRAPGDPVAGDAG